MSAPPGQQSQNAGVPELVHTGSSAGRFPLQFLSASGHVWNVARRSDLKCAEVFFCRALAVGELQVSQLRAVLFDLGGTLWEWYPGLTPEGILATVAPGAMQLLSAEQAALVTPESLAKAIRQAYLESEHAACRRDMTATPVELVARRGLASLGVAIDSKTAKAVIDALYVPERQTTRLLPFAGDTLAALSRSGLRLGVVSNRMHGGRTTARRPHVFWHWDVLQHPGNVR